ncbi:MAG TPA: guanylate kinase [Candidatus Mediterraneibacter gallistercoris]|uniref:Guanylate kinase n=1 Tax=Candidatus Mediterraneibacter gallistercoris TaxID=2838671 RepID=A0A9D2P4J0_9FIRM|nr:guanylate kinase [Candidatus Mediterraneibacter gallistercoris]
MGKIYYVMGKSSSGKDTIYKELLKRHPEFHTIVPYTTRPIREGEHDGVEYYFVDEKRLKEMQQAGQVIEVRSYNTKCGIWTYFTADDGQIDLEQYDYLVIGTLVSYEAMKRYFGKNVLVPIYIEVEDGERLCRALEREKKQQVPRYAEMCRRFLADEKDFAEDNLQRAEITYRFENADLSDCLTKIENYIGL